MLATGYVLSVLIAVLIIFVGARFLLVPVPAAAGYGVPLDRGEAIRSYTSVKGIRDLASGLVVLVPLLMGEYHVLGGLMLAFSVIPLTDAVIVRRGGGSWATALGIHFATAVVMWLTAGLLLAS